MSFGTDISAYTAWQPIDNVADLFESYVRRLTTPRGSLYREGSEIFNDPYYGFDLREYINHEMTSRARYEIQTLSCRQLELDPRTESAEMVFTQVNINTIHLAYHVETALGPYELITTIDKVASVLGFEMPQIKLSSLKVVAKL